jgi:hypothetical protein
MGTACIGPYLPSFSSVRLICPALHFFKWPDERPTSLPRRANAFLVFSFSQNSSGHASATLIEELVGEPRAHGDDLVESGPIEPEDSVFLSDGIVDPALAAVMPRMTNPPTIAVTASSACLERERAKVSGAGTLMAGVTSGLTPALIGGRARRWVKGRDVEQPWGTGMGLCRGVRRC